MIQREHRRGKLDPFVPGMCTHAMNAASGQVRAFIPEDSQGAGEDVVEAVKTSLKELLETIPRRATGDVAAALEDWVSATRSIAPLTSNSPAE
jgi:hypothetical protein